VTFATIGRSRNILKGEKDIPRKPPQPGRASTTAGTKMFKTAPPWEGLDFSDVATEVEEE
jgi:hypothetical protein